MRKSAGWVLWLSAVAGNLVVVLASCFFLSVSVEARMRLSATLSWPEFMTLIALFVIPTLSLSALWAFRPRAETRRTN
jgi:hypothetical protein